MLARLREQEPWPELDAIAITHWHLDHWGDLVPWVWGRMFGPGEDTKKPGALDSARGAEMLEGIGRAPRVSGHVLGHVRPERVTSTGEPFETAGFEVTAERVLHHELLAFGFRASANGAVLAYSGDSGPSDALPRLAQDADLFVCEATLLAPNPEGGTRGHLASDEAVEAFEAADAKRLLITHRPRERPPRLIARAGSRRHGAPGSR